MIRDRVRHVAVAGLATAVGLSMPLVAFASGGGSGGVARSAAAALTRPAVGGSGARDDALLVHLKPGLAAAAAGAALQSASATVVGRLDAINTLVVAPLAGHGRAAVQAALSADPAVASVEVDEAAHVTLDPNDPLW